jgi:NAD(P)H dehydrogenase (quinone)
MGFGFQPVGSISDPLLVGRRLITFSTSGAPETWMRDTGALAALGQLFDRHLAAMCGLRVLDHVHLGGITPMLSREGAEACLNQVRQVVAREFAPPPAA